LKVSFSSERDFTVELSVYYLGNTSTPVKTLPFRYRTSRYLAVSPSLFKSLDIILNSTLWRKWGQNTGPSGTPLPLPAHDGRQSLLAGSAVNCLMYQCITWRQEEVYYPISLVSGKLGIWKGQYLRSLEYEKFGI
jgi:hypothetical protein